MISGPDIAWLAGFADGEGSLNLILGRNQRRPYIKPVFQIGNTHRPSADRVKELLTAIIGRQVRYTPYISRTSGRPFYATSVTKQAELKVLCEALAPYSVTKSAQIALMLRYLAIAPGWHGGRADETSYGEAHFGMVVEMRLLNAKWPHAARD